jgi:hypothetical protein
MVLVSIPSLIERAEAPVGPNANWPGLSYAWDLVPDLLSDAQPQKCKVLSALANILADIGLAWPSKYELGSSGLQCGLKL